MVTKTYKAAVLLTLLVCGLLMACTDDDTRYTSFYARCIVTPVTAVPPLYTAVNNAGEYVMMWRETNGNLLFVTPSGASLTVAPTALSSYQPWTSATGAGFIVGKQNVPDLSTGQLTLVAYDRVCPNCYREDINRNLAFANYGFVSCTRCQRTYDLNNGGTVTAGAAGYKLEAYRQVVYNSGQNILSISN